MGDIAVVKQFKEMSLQVMKENEGKELFGPMGHKTEITKDSFRNAFPIFLQEFEAALLKHPINQTIKYFPDSELLFSFHDGCTIAVKETEHLAFVEVLNKNVYDTGKLLKLEHDQVMEVQNVYPTEEGLRGLDSEVI